ncbi:MAG: DUF1326 domain-containing protein [Acidobacteriota bacterium]|nr:DUF1326 domain-containing protein [Acidobacteriota bacterium]
MAFPWKISGEIVLSCNCDVFCPCVISLGKSEPSRGACHTWWALHIDEGHAGHETLDGLNVAMLMDIPGPLAHGSWTLALYVDDRATPAAAAALTEIMTGKAGGTTSWFRIVVAEFLGAKTVPISFNKKGKGWSVQVPKIIDGTVEPIAGAGGHGLTKVTNSAYWIAPDIVVCAGTRSRFRDWGRNWDLTGLSAEYAKVEWAGP